MGIKLRIPKDVLYAVTQTLSTLTTVGQGINYNCNPEIKNALQYQHTIGISMMARSFLTKQWLHTVHPGRNPPRIIIMVKLQCLVWMEFFEHLWKNRNDLLHHSITTPSHHYTINFYIQEDDSKLAKSITWYCDNCHLLFTHHDTHLASNINPSTSTLQMMPLNQK